MIKRVIHPDDRALSAWLEKLPETFSREGEVIHRGRNEIRKIAVGNRVLNVKRFGIPFLFNRWVYGGIRKSKAQRSYEYGMRLLSLEIPTPRPIAWMLEKRRGLIGTAYYVSEQVDYPRRMNEFGTEPLAGKEWIVDQFARFTASLHQKGVYHRDYSPGNILFRTEGEKASFCLVDINRISFLPVSLERGCANFARLWGQTPFFERLADAYAEARSADAAWCRRRILYYRRRFWKAYRKRHALKFDLDI